MLVSVLKFYKLTCLYSNKVFSGELENNGKVHPKEQSSSVLKGNKLGIIIPFRERFDELMEFVPHIHLFLKNQDISHEIFVINQVTTLV